MNNEKNYNGKRNKKSKPAKANPNEFKVVLHLSEEANENINNEIIDVLANTRFDKISIPVGTYRNLAEECSDADDNRVCTIGYIRNYDANTKEFTLIIFDKFTKKIKDLGDIVMGVSYTSFKDSLRTITKFNLLPIK